VIGAGSTIGANVFLMHSVPPNSLVIQEPKQVTVFDKTKASHRKSAPLEWQI